MTAADAWFAGFGLVAVLAALLAVTSRRVVHCALWLVLALGSLAGVFLVLGAEVVALVQILVYVGAVAVLVLFVMMLTRAPTRRSRDLDAGRGQRALAALVGAGLAAVIGTTLVLAIGGRTIAVDAGRGAPGPVGTAMFGGWVLPFELLSVLLLAALVAALAISRGQGE